MGTSKDVLHDRIFELETMLDFVEKHYKQVYDEAEAHYMNLIDNQQ